MDFNSPMGSVLFLSIFTTTIVFLFEFSQITGRRPPFKYYRIVIMSITAFLCLISIAYTQDRPEIDLFNHTAPSFYIASVIFVYYLPIMISDYFTIYKRCKRQKTKKSLQFLLHIFKTEIRTNLTNLLLYPIIEGIIFVAFYNTILQKSLNSVSTVLMSSILYGYSKIYYYTTSAALSNTNKWPLIQRTAIYILQSFIFAVVINLIWIYSHSLLTVIVANSFLNYFDFPNPLYLWEKHSTSFIQIFIRLAIVFAHIYAFSVTMMFITADDVNKL